MIAEVLALYGSEAAPEKKTARNIAYRIGNLLNWWGEKTTADISAKSCKEYARTKNAPAAGADIKTLRAAVKYWHASECGVISDTPGAVAEENTRERMSGLDRNPSCPICECGEKCRNMCGE